MKTIDLSQTHSDSSRTVSERRIVTFLLSPYEVARGNRERDLPLAQAMLDRRVALGLPFRTDPSGLRLFDPAEVVNFIKPHISPGRSRCGSTERSQCCGG
jgi:hypothetical protein